MNDYISEITLDLNCERSCRTIMLTQFDKGKKIHLTVKANGEPYSVSGCSVVLKGVNSDGSRVAVDCNIEPDGTATAVTDDITFAVKGFAAARFVISDSQRTYNTQRFLIYVDDALDTDVTSDPAYSILNRLIREVQLIDEHGGIIVDDELSSTSTHPVQNRIVNAALNAKAPLLTAYTFDSTTASVGYNADNPKTIYTNATVNGKSAFVLTTSNNYYQIALCVDGTEYTRELTAGGSVIYKPWAPVNNEKTDNKTSAINSSNRTSTDYYPSIKAVVDYLAANYEALSNKLTSAYGIDEDSTDAQYPTAKAVYEFGAEIVDVVGEDISATDAAIADLKTYLGYTSGDILGLCADFENKRFTRLGAAVGKNAGSDFDVFPMYGERRRVVVDSDGVIDDSIAPASVTETDYDLDVMVYQPKFYYKVVPLKLEKQSSGLGYHIRKANYYITSTPHAGFKVHPLFIDKNGNEVDYVLFSAYEASYFHNETGNYSYFHDGAQTNANIDWSHDELKSSPGVKPISGQYKAMNRVNMENLAQRKSTDWHLDTIQSVCANQLLMAIEYGSFNTQTALGNGVVSNSSSGSNNCSSITGSTSAAAFNTASGMASETIYDVAGTQTAFSANGKVAVSYRGMENPWGNIWKHVNGINIWGDGSMNGGQVYICSNYSFNEESHSDNYKSAGFTVANSNGQISAFGYGDENCDWLFMPSETTGNSSLPVGDYFWCSSNLNSGQSGYRAAPFGGRWSDGTNAGGYYWRCNSTAGIKDYYIGGRLLFVPAATV